MSCVIDWNEGQGHGVDNDSTVKSIFEMITMELGKLGAIPLNHYAFEDNPQEYRTLEGNSLTLATNSHTITPEEDTFDISRNVPLQATATIIETCVRVLETSDAVSFEYKEDRGPESLECILTVTRPNGRKRSYTSGPCFSKRPDARERAASVALEMGVIEFIKYGDIDAKSRSALTLGSAEASSKLKTSEDSKGVSLTDTFDIDIDDPNVKAISDCCLEWRAGITKPVYLYFSEPTFVPRVQGKKAKTPVQEDLTGLKQGCALSITLSQHTSRVYSVHHIYSTRSEAKSAVAAVAIKQGVIDFIKHANGQKSAMVFIRELDGDANENLNMEVISQQNPREKEISIEATSVNFTLKKHQIPLDAMTLQAFTNSLPRPFPETHGLKPLGDGNPVGWLNTAVQSARGSRMMITWTYLSNAKLSLHGCLVRFNLPRIEDGRSYLVEPQFIKRSDAKAAVALLAISQDIGGWIAEITRTVEDQISPEMRAKSGSILVSLSQECVKARMLGQPIYDYTYEDGAVGCILKVEFSPSLKREYSVPVEYRTKADARFAVVLKAYREGVFEFIRFRGEDPPHGYNADDVFNWRSTHRVDAMPIKRDEFTGSRTHREHYWDPDYKHRERNSDRYRQQARWDDRNKTTGKSRNDAYGMTGHTSGQLPFDRGEFNHETDARDQQTCDGIRSSVMPVGTQASAGRRFLHRPWESDHEGIRSEGSSDMQRGTHEILTGPPVGYDAYSVDISHPAVEIGPGFLSEGGGYQYGDSQVSVYNPYPYSLPLPPPPPPPSLPSYLPIVTGPPQGWNYPPSFSLEPLQQVANPMDGSLAGGNTTGGLESQSHPSMTGERYWESSNHLGKQETERKMSDRSQRQSTTWDSRYGERRSHQSASTSSYEPGNYPAARGGIVGQQQQQQQTRNPRGLTNAAGTYPAGRHVNVDQGRPLPASRLEEEGIGVENERKRPSEVVRESTSRKRPRQSGRFVTALSDYCTRNGIPSPVFNHERTAMGQFRVIAMVGKEKYSLRQTFGDIESGRDEVARRVIHRLTGAKLAG
ncbi:hypothetical protein FRC16_008775 [Serendipita sp. 398]|nr:hypothetical protein FRC16_008775 [Serendipita sp. 398]